MVGFFFFNDTATTEIYTLSLHDALPISREVDLSAQTAWQRRDAGEGTRRPGDGSRSEEHTSELQSQSNLVCRLLLEKKQKASNTPCTPIPTAHHHPLLPHSPHRIHLHP